jgi:lysozyme
VNLSDNGAKFIASHELALPPDGTIPDKYLRPYNDPVGFATIAIGHLIAKRPVTQADRDQWGTLTQQQAYDLFRSDTRRFIDAVARRVTVPITQNQADALISLAYNIGEGNFGKSTLLKKLNAGDYRGASNEFPKWNKAKGKVLKGLTRRRAEERALFLRADPGGAATIQIPVAASQDIPRLPGESKEVAHLREYLRDSGVPHRITSTVRSELPSRHAQMGTDGEGLAVDAGGPKPGWDTPEMLAIFKVFEPVEHLLYELIYSGAPYSIKRGKRVARYAIDKHWNHVHVAVNKGVFIEFPSARPTPTEEEDEDVLRIIKTLDRDPRPDDSADDHPKVLDGVYVETNFSFVKWIPNNPVWDTIKQYAKEGVTEPVVVLRSEFETLQKVGNSEWPK